MNICVVLQNGFTVLNLVKVFNRVCCNNDRSNTCRGQFLIPLGHP